MDIYQCLKLISCQVFSPNCQKNNMGATWGVSDAPMMGGIMGASDVPHDAPHVIFSKNKKLSFQSNVHHHPTHSPQHHHPQPSPPIPPPTQPKSTQPPTHPITHTTSHHPTTSHPPKNLQPPTMEKKWGLNA